MLGPAQAVPGPGPDPIQAVATALALAAIGAATAGAAAALHRWYADTTIPQGLAVLVGASVVALYLNATTVLAQVSSGQTNLTAADVLTNVVVFGAAAFAAAAGARVGDGLAADLFDDTPDVQRIVRSVGRLTAVTLPEEIEDMPEYDPVTPETKAALAGVTLNFPRRLTLAELRDRLVGRLKTDYGVGHVDIDLEADGTVSYLAVGSRLSGLGPTLPPGTAAVAARADPALAASAGDRVQLYRDGERVATAELRGVAGDIVTLALDAADAPAIDDDIPYRLVTLPASPTADRQFISLLRTVDETFGAATVVEGSDLAGMTVGALAPAVVAVQSGGSVETIPDRSRRLAPGDVVYAVGRSDALRRLGAAATGNRTIPAPEADTTDD